MIPKRTPIMTPAPTRLSHPDVVQPMEILPSFLDLVASPDTAASIDFKQPCSGHVLKPDCTLLALGLLYRGG